MICGPIVESSVQALGYAAIRSLVVRTIPSGNRMRAINFFSWLNPWRHRQVFPPLYWKRGINLAKGY